MQPMTELEAETLRDYYGKFARLEASGTSPIFTAWAEGVATDDEVISLLLELPRPKRQANLLFAAARHLGAGEGSGEEKVGVALRSGKLEEERDDLVKMSVSWITSSP